jgi:hypothetical protein
MSLFKPFFSQNNENNKNVEELARLKSIYEIAIKTRNFEIQQLVQRNNFFMIFQGVLIACIIYSNNTVPFIHTAICFIGIFLSFSKCKLQLELSFGKNIGKVK